MESLTLEETAGKFISDVSFRVVEDQLTKCRKGKKIVFGMVIRESITVVVPYISTDEAPDGGGSTGSGDRNVRVGRNGATLGRLVVATILSI